MAEAGCQETVPRIFLWEGVTNYLTADAVDVTLRWCARAVAGSLLIFTYIHRDVLTDPGTRPRVLPGGVRESGGQLNGPDDHTMWPPTIAAATRATPGR